MKQTYFMSNLLLTLASTVFLSAQSFAQPAEECLLAPASATVATAIKGQLVNLVVGDASTDGHNQTSSILICSNKSKAEIHRAERASVASLGFDFTAVVAEDYDESKLSEDHARKLRDFGISLTAVEENENILYADSFTDIYLQIVKKVDPTFSYRLIHPQSLDIGGYGLFQ